MIKFLFAFFLAIQTALAATGAATAPDNQSALQTLRARAEAGDVNAQLNLGGIYFEGSEVGQDYVEGAKWFRLAAKRGLAEAQFNLGMIYATGLGVEKDPAEAVRWYRLAAAQGLAIAQLNLGVAYSYGEGVAKSELEAANWFRQAADQGEAQAQFNLAVMYAKGQGMKQDLVEAYRYARLAAVQKHEIAKALLADLSRKMTIEQQTLATQLATPNVTHVAAAGKDDIYAQLVDSQPTSKIPGEPQKPQEPATSTADVQPAGVDVPLPPSQADTAQIENFVNNWAAAWSAMNVQDYLASYLPDFKPPGMNREEWVKQRTDRIQRPGRIKIRLSQLSVSMQDASHATVSFTQDYRSDNYRDRQKKILLLIKPSERWLIAEEHELSTHQSALARKKIQQNP